MSQIIRDDDITIKRILHLKKCKNTEILAMQKVKQRMHNAQARQTRVKQIQLRKVTVAFRKKIKRKYFLQKV